MKKILFILLVSITISAKSEILSDYHPLLEDGKIWVLENVWHEIYNHPPTLTKVWIEGDTIVDGKTAVCLAKMDMDSELSIKYIPVVEESRQIYFYNDLNNRWLPVMDFSSSQGEETLPFCFDDSSSDVPSIVEEEKFITIMNHDYRSLKVNGNYWIEGIGSPSMYIMTIFPMAGAGPIQHLKECYLNEELIFSDVEWGKISGISNSTISNAKELTIYDLHGREVSSPVPGSIYIRVGKKFVAE